MFEFLDKSYIVAGTDYRGWRLFHQLHATNRLLPLVFAAITFHSAFKIYYSENLGATWGKPVNLGARFNTVNDDSHFQIYFNIKKAVLAGIEENEGVYNYDIIEVNVEGMDYPFLK
jgi:hypothetical protein